MGFLDIQQVVFTYPGRMPVVDGVDWRVQAGLAEAPVKASSMSGAHAALARLFCSVSDERH